MAQNISLLGATYSAVPAVTLPKSGGGTATFIEETELANAGNNTPLVDSGNGSAGTSTSYSREDHVHPVGFKYTTFSITTTSQKVSSITAYTENGVVFVEVELAASLTTGWHNDISLTIPTDYRPRSQIYGSFRINSGSDSGKSFFANLGTSSLQLYIGESNSGKLNFQFVYPLKT